MTLRVIDTDVELLRTSADASLHAAEQTTIHIEAEIAGLIPELVATLRSEGPYGYTIRPEVTPDGAVNLPILSTREEIRDAYTVVRGASDLLRVEPLVELRGAWYSFHEAISHAQPKGMDMVFEVPTLALFPVSTDDGITGELVWVYVDPANLGSRDDAAAAEEGEPDRWVPRRELLARHDRFLDGLRAADIDAVVDELNDGVQSAVRNYVDDTGALVSLQGKDAHRAYFAAFFDAYEIRGVDLLDRVVQDWYVFAELRFTTLRRADGAPACFHTAEYHVPANDGRFIARIGHGTDAT